MPKPNFFIVGAPKCGTTAMYEYLKSHPDIYLSPLKEIYYFGQDLQYVHFERPNEATYLSYFDGATNQSIVGEASITYLVSTQAAQEIKAFNSEARILIMLRNPVDMMYSMHSQALFTQVEDVQDFAQALALESARKQGKHIPPKTTILNFILYRELATYTEQVQRYFDVFGHDNVHVILYDDFKQDTSLVYSQMLQFLDIDDTYVPETFDRINSNKMRRNEWLTSLLKNPQIVKTVRRLIPNRNLRQKIAVNTQMLTIQERPRHPLDKDLQHLLREEFLPEIEKLGALLGRDLTEWCESNADWDVP